MQFIDPGAACRADRFPMKTPLGANIKEKKMKMMSTADLYRKTQRELGAMKQQAEKELGACEQQKRHCQAALANIRTAQTRKVMRPNL